MPGVHKAAAHGERLLIPELEEIHPIWRGYAPITCFLT